MVTALRLLLFPFSLLFGIVVRIRMAWYASRGWKSPIPTLVVGNLSTGGTGKTPHTMLVAEILLQHGKQVATLSRGYGRKTKGFLEVETSSKAWEVGDEPLMMKRRYPELPVFVCENRVKGIEKIQASREKGHNKRLDYIVLDDAYQHLALKPHFSIVLLTYDSLQKPWFVLPAGDGREPLSALSRSHLVMVTKCPADIPEEQKEKIRNRLSRYTSSPVFFSTYTYLGFINHKGENVRPDTGRKAILLVGIARPLPLLAWLDAQFSQVDPVLFADHHLFTEQELQAVISNAEDAYIIITEKDRTRIQDVAPVFLENERVLVIPIVPDLGRESAAFEQFLLNTLTGGI